MPYVPLEPPMRMRLRKQLLQPLDRGLNRDDISRVSKLRVGDGTAI